ncbi:MAG: hypothetical protein AAFX05_02010 [Planctomycetota bacterium]
MVAEVVMHEDTIPLTREQLIANITVLNPTAPPTFLAHFDTLQLANYLQHLLAAQEPRGACARWVRPADSPAILRYEAAA